MTFVQRYSKTKRLHWHIERKATGKPLHMARKLGVSKTSLYDYINILKEFGAEVGYCASRESFYYVNEFRFPC